jgi:hypothetical protein
MKKQFLLLLIGAFALNFAFAQTSDTVKTPGGTVIINIDHKPKQIPNRQNQKPPATPDSKTLNLNVEVIQKPADSFLSNEGIIFAILLAIAVTWLVALSLRRRVYHCNCCRNWPNNINLNGTMRHEGNVSMTHAGRVTHEGNVNHSGKVEHTTTPAAPADSGRH